MMILGYITATFIQGRHRTPNSQIQTPTTTATQAATNNITVQSAVQVGARSHVQHTDALATMEPYQLNNHLDVWWTKLVMCLEEVPEETWVKKTLMHIDEHVLAKLGSNLMRYKTMMGGFDQLYNDIKALKSTPNENKGMAANWIREMSQRKQLKNESAEEYGTALRKLAVKCGKIEEDALGSLYCNGLADKELGRVVARKLHTTGFKDWEEIVNYASHTEQGWSTAEESMREPEQAIQQRRKQLQFTEPTNRQTYNRDWDENTKEQHEGQETQQRNRTSNSQSFPRHHSPPKGSPNSGGRQNNRDYEATQRYQGPQCYQCRGYGHLQRFCPHNLDQGKQ